jgi:hypothetical protein
MNVLAASRSLFPIDFDFLGTGPMKSKSRATKPKWPPNENSLKPIQGQSEVTDQTSEFDHVGHSKLRIPSLLPSLPCPNSPAGLILLDIYCLSSQKVRGQSFASQCGAVS